ncbi:16729_t:CDS:2, partial [Gigaspora margarita]
DITNTVKEKKRKINNNEASSSKRAKSSQQTILYSMNSMSELKRHVTIIKALVEFIRFVSHPIIQNNICNIIYSNLELCGSTRSQNFCGIVISGGSGIGETHIGFKTKNFIFDDKRIRKSAWTLPDIRKYLELMPDESEDYDNVINLICKEKNLKNAESLVLILQINEFHSANYWMVTLLRIISSLLLKGTLIIAICTGTTPSQIAELGDDQSCKISASHENKFDDSSKIYHSIVNSIRGIPSIIEIATKEILNMKKAKLNAFENFDMAKDFYMMQLKQKDEKLNSFTTIQDFETMDYLKLFDIFDESLLRPFELLTEETFQQFVLHMHHITYSLAFRTGSTITIRDIYGGCVRGSNRVLDCNIDVQQQIEYYAHASLIPKTENGFSKPGLLDRTNLPIIVSNKNGFKETDVT